MEIVRSRHPHAADYLQLAWLLIQQISAKMNMTGTLLLLRIIKISYNYILWLFRAFTNYIKI